jgi:hypothetical protein
MIFGVVDKYCEVDMGKQRQGSHGEVTYKQLLESWWKIYDGYSWCRQEDTRNYFTQRSFEDLLGQCGWTIAQWNDENDSYRKGFK